MEVHYHTSPMTSLPVAQASRLDKQALTLSNQGNHTGAEQLHRQALQMKLDAVGESNTTTAVTRNALGELYLKMGRLDEAEEQLRRAVVVRTTSGNVFDAAVSVENLARMYEAKGDLTAALDTRLSYDPNNMVCGNYKCSGQTFKQGDLRRCSACRAVFYCSETCQQKDWQSRHKRFCSTRRSTSS